MVDMKFLAAAALLTSVALLPVWGGVVLALVPFGLFLLALVGVLGALEDRTVQQHQPVLEPRRWRDGS
jgi:hypothetical protein